MHVEQCVPAIRAVEVPVLVCLHSSCNHVTSGRAVKFVSLALKGLLKNEGDLVDVTMLYDWCYSEASCYTLGKESKTSMCSPLA